MSDMAFIKPLLFFNFGGSTVLTKQCSVSLLVRLDLCWLAGWMLESSGPLLLRLRSAHEPQALYPCWSWRWGSALGIELGPGGGKASVPQTWKGHVEINILQMFTHFLGMALAIFLHKKGIHQGIPGEYTGCGPSPPTHVGTKHAKDCFIISSLTQWNEINKSCVSFSS